MITNFNKYSRILESSEPIDLIEYVDFHFIEEYFDKNYDVDIDEAIYSYPGYIWDNIDDKRFVADFERDYLENQSLDDVNDDDIKEYVLKNLSYDKKAKILEMYLEKNEDEEEEDLYDADDYENMLDEFDDDEIKEVAEEDEDSYDIARSILGGSFEGQTAEDIIGDFYGMDTRFYEQDKRLNNRYDFEQNYDSNVKQLKDLTMSYVDEDAIKKENAENEDDDYKKEVVSSEIYNSPDMQKNILANYPSQTLNLFELLENESNGDNISNEYDFQKAYIEQYAEENPEDEDEDMVVAYAIKNIFDTFELNDNIKKEYHNDLILVTTAEFNI